MAARWLKTPGTETRLIDYVPGYPPRYDRAHFKPTRPPFLPSLLCALLGAVLLSGCASSNYLTDRWNDAKDIGTATVGVGGGAKARVGRRHRFALGPRLRRSAGW